MKYESKTNFLELEHEKSIFTIRFNRPDALNALRPEMLAEMERLIRETGDDSSVSVIVLEGAGRSFSAGVDLKVLQGIQPAGGKIGDLFDEPARRAYLAIRESRCPVIAKVHGACFTGALEIALHCDFVFTTIDTKFGDTHAKFGLRPTWGMTQTLAQAVGIRKAKELSFTGRTLLGSEAARIGIANEAVADRTELDALVSQRASEIATNSQGAVSAIKDLYGLAQEGLSMAEGLQRELGSEYPGISDTAERLSKF